MKPMATSLMRVFVRSSTKFWGFALLSIMVWNIRQYQLFISSYDNEKISCRDDDFTQITEQTAPSSSSTNFRNWPTGYFSIYIYELPPHLNYVREKSKSNGSWGCSNMFGAEWVIPNLLQTSPTWKKVWNVTKNPDEATIFFVPATFSCGLQAVMYDGPGCPWGTNQSSFRDAYITETINYIRTHYPYYNRSNGGEDHILPLTMSSARCEVTGTARELVRNMMIFTLVGYLTDDSEWMQRQCFDRARDVVVPPYTYLQQDEAVIQFQREMDIFEDMSPYRAMRPDTPFPIPISNHRENLLYFRGSMSHPLRSLTLQKYKGQQGADIDEGWANNYELYVRGFYNSEFAMCPRGGQPSSPRFIDAMNGRSIPAVISDDWLPAFADEFPPELYSVRVPERDVEDGKLLDIIRNVSKETKDGLRENMPRALHVFGYEFDAMFWIQRQVAKRAPDMWARARWRG